MTARPVPVPDDESRPYWDAAAEHELHVAKCARCSALVLPPEMVCPHCGSSDPAFAFTPVSGRGTVRSWTIVHQSFLPGFDVPFVLVDVELEEQAELRLIGRLVDGVDAPLQLGDRVTVVFEDLAPGVSIPAFALAS